MLAACIGMSMAKSVHAGLNATICYSHENCMSGGQSVDDDDRNEDLLCHCDRVVQPGISHVQHGSTSMTVYTIAPEYGEYCFDMNYTTAEIWHETSWSLTGSDGGPAIDLRQFADNIACSDDDEPCSYRAQWCSTGIPAGAQISVTQSRLISCIPFDLQGCRFTITGLSVQYNGYQQSHDSQHEPAHLPPPANAQPALRGAE